VTPRRPALLAALTLAACAGGEGATDGLAIRALSTHAAHVSGGDVLVEVAALVSSR